MQTLARTPSPFLCARRSALLAPAILLAAAVPGAAEAAEQIRAPGLCWPAGQVAAFQLGAPEAFYDDPLAVSWDFGDGSRATGWSAERAYSSPGLHRVTVSVSRGGGVSVGQQSIFVTGPTTAPRPTCAIYRFAAVRLRSALVLRSARVSGRVVFPDGEGSAGRMVGLRDPRRRVVARTSTASSGRFAFRHPMPAPGRWSVVLLDDGPGNGPEAAVDRRPRLNVSPPRAPVGPGVPLVVRGTLDPRVDGKLVQLEFLGEGSWRPVAQARTGARGRFSLAYGFRRSGVSYSVLMRVAAPRDRGWAHPTVASRPFRVRVSG